MITRKDLALPICLAALILPSCFAQAPAATAKLHEVRITGEKALTEAQIVAISELAAGAQVSRDDLQAAADKLVKTGYFSKVGFNFLTHGDDLTVTYAVEEAPRLPAYFDNFPWFSDSELHDAIRKKLVFYDGTLPEGGAIVDQAADALIELLASHGLPGALSHQVAANPLGDGNVQEFQIEGATLKIATLEFSDPSLLGSKAVQQHLSEIIGKPYSRAAIDLFLSEQLRPVYQQLGLLRAKLGPPEVHLTGNPNQNLPEQIPVFVPISPGSVYRWKGARWSGNAVLSEFTLSNLMKLKSDDVANGLEMEAGWDRIREEYGHHGYLDIKVAPAISFDDTSHTVTCNVSIQEGRPSKFGKLVITGLSLAAEKILRGAFPIQPGEVFDKTKYEDLLLTLQAHPARIFGELPVHFETVGHFLQTEESTATVDALLDFK